VIDSHKPNCADKTIASAPILVLAPFCNSHMLERAIDFIAIAATLLHEVFD
jgi:hypothetical protein